MSTGSFQGFDSPSGTGLGNVSLDGSTVTYDVSDGAGGVSATGQQGTLLNGQTEIQPVGSPTPPAIALAPSASTAQAGQAVNARLSSSGSAASAEEATFLFADSDLINGVLTRVHNFNRPLTSILVKDELGEIVEPDQALELDNNRVSISLESFGAIPGTWKLSIET